MCGEGNGVSFVEIDDAEIFPSTFNFHAHIHTIHLDIMYAYATS